MSVLLALLVAGVFVGLAKAMEVSFIVTPSEDEVVQKIQLSASDNIVGNISVENGSFIDFFVTSPSYDMVFQSNKTSFETFNITASDTGTYVMHFVNKYQSNYVNVSLSYGTNFFRSATEIIHVLTTTTISSQTTITYVNSNLHMDVNPQGFPPEGNYWHFHVYYQYNSSDGNTNILNVPNALIEITIMEGNKRNFENITTDQNGDAVFQFWHWYTDLFFQATSQGNMSDAYTVTQGSNHWVTTDFVNSVTNTSTIFLGITSLSEVVLVGTLMRKRITRIYRALLVLVFSYGVFLFIISQIASMTQNTPPFGYPSSIFGLLTWNVLQYANFVFWALFLILTAIAFLPKFDLLKQPEK